MATAVDIIDTRRDLAGKRALGMGERDLARRARLLDDLRRKWAQPHPRPLTRRVQSRPDAFVFDVGDCVAYPVASDGGAINPYFARAEADPRWKPAGVGALAVLARGHRHRVFAWYGVARLSLEGAEKPALAQCAAAMIEAESSPLADRLGEKPRLCVYGSRLTPLHARKMRFDVIGRLPLDDRAIREDFAGFFAPTFVPGTCLANELAGYTGGTRTPSGIPLARYVTTG
jgi:hypothetical protein